MNEKRLIRNILITGGAGFIGSNMADYFIEQGYTVRVLDNFATGKKENIEQILHHPRFALLKGDIRSLDTCMQACSNIDIVFHQAALGSVTRSVHDPILTNQVNLDGTINMLVAARDCNVEKFIYASSSSVYGDIDSAIKQEGVEGNPISPYAITKKTNEYYAQIFFKLYKLKTIGLRYFNVFGESQDPNAEYAAVIPLFIKAAMLGQKVTINGDGTQCRDFTYVSNVIQANMKAMTMQQDEYGTVFNIGCGQSTSVLALVHKIYQMVGRKPAIEYAPPRTGDVKESCANIERAMKFLHYQPDFSLDIGLQKTIQWFKKQNHGC